MVRDTLVAMAFVGFTVGAFGSMTIGFVSFNSFSTRDLYNAAACFVADTWCARERITRGLRRLCGFKSVPGAPPSCTPSAGFETCTAIWTGDLEPLEDTMLIASAPRRV